MRLARLRGLLCASLAASVAHATSGGPVDHFAVSAQTSATLGRAFNVTVTALDASSDTVPTYSGTVAITSTDGAALLPPNAGMASGVGTFAVALNTAGTWTPTATDTVTSSITGTSGPITAAVAPTTPNLYWTNTASAWSG